jgi:phenylpyruvate tautomerase PptA (4-oxalocrotonate tautomerase family)
MDRAVERLVLKKRRFMPHLQLDVPNKYPLSVKRDLAARLGRHYAEIMQTTPDLVHVTFRELGEGGVWRCTNAEPVTPAAVLSCDIRRGRTPEQRARLGEALFNACVEALGLDPVLMNVEFTQHAGDEIYGKILVDGALVGGLARDWSPSETETSLLTALAAENSARK